MKRIFPFLLLFLFNIPAFAAKHVKFVGLPMGGPRKVFFNKLPKKGFQQIDRPEFITDTLPGKTYFWGVYKGFSNSIVQVSGKGDNSKNVDKVVVVMDACNSWRGVYDYYAKIKQALTKEYGQPKECREMFHINGQPKTDDDLFLEVRHGNCEYVSIFSTKSGAVMVSINYYNRQARAFVTYIDKGPMEQMER